MPRALVENTDPAIKCSKCTRPRESGSKLCDRCKKLAMAHYCKRRQRCIEEGLCVRCTMKPAVLGLRHCQPCREYFNRATTPAYKRKWRLKAHYNMTPDEWSRMLAAQGGVCVICEQPGKPATRAHTGYHVDHCHRTGRVRGLLCHKCNQAIGLLQDSADACANAAAYLRKHAMLVAV